MAQRTPIDGPLCAHLDKVKLATLTQRAEYPAVPRITIFLGERESAFIGVAKMEVMQKIANRSPWDVSFMTDGRLCSLSGSFLV